MSPRPVLIMAGGTGGHVYPALAVADYLREKQVPLYWLGTPKGLEARVVPERGYTLLTINVSGLRGKGMARWLQAPWVLTIALLQTIKIYLRLKPSVVLGMGGFVSGPGGVAAWLLRIPLCIHEQNAIAGLTNRVLAPLARTVMQAFPDTFNNETTVRTTGNPVRADIFRVLLPEQRMNLDPATPMRVLVLGGSLGARTLNRIIPETLTKLPGTVRLEVKHQTGTQHHEETLSLYNTSGCAAEVLPYIEDMAKAYAWADIIICRAGALTIAELAAAGVAAILVPFPYAVDDHQTANARYLSGPGAAVLVQERELTSDRLRDLLVEFCQSRTLLLTMAQTARRLARPDATRDVAECCLEVTYAG